MDAADVTRAPAGVVSFLMTDVVSSTRIWSESTDAARAMARQAELIRSAVSRHDGVRPPDQGEGDSTLAVFERPGEALAAALDAQRALESEPWPESARVRVRMAVNTGEAERLENGNYGGTALIRCARLRSLAHGGQILASNTTTELVGDRLPEGASVVALGTVALDGFERSERVHQLVHAELPTELARLAPLRSVASRGLAAWPTALVGRQREREELAARIESSRLVTITGAGGSGKTRLAHAVAEDLGERFADGVVWVELARVASGEQVASAVAAACGVPETQGASALEVLVERLSGSELLVVLDNCEHVLDASCELADAVLRGGAGVRMLVTTREPLGVAGEVSWRIPSLALPPEDETLAERIAPFDAVRLFVERARAAHPDFALDADNARHVSRVCRRLDGIPLALELAAARLRALSVAKLAEGLDDRFRLLVGGARRSVERQRTLRASVEWSYGLLEEPERQLFRRLAVFAAPFSLEAAEAVGGGDDLDRFEVFDLLVRLVDKSLVQHAGDRYRMLETLRQYALERAEEAGELAALRDRHLGWMRQRAAGWALDRELCTDGVLEQIEDERPDLLSAVDWSITSGAVATELLTPLSQYWLIRAAIEEAHSVSQRVLSCFEPSSPEWLEALAPMADGLFVLGELDWLADVRASLVTNAESLPIKVRNLVELSFPTGGNFFAGSGAATAQRAIDHARAVGNRSEEITGSVNLLMALAQTGRIVEARRVLAWLDRHLPKDASVRAICDLGRAIVSCYGLELATMRTLLAGIAQGRVHQIGAAGQLAMLSLWTRDTKLAEQSNAVLEGKGTLGIFAGFRRLSRAFVALLAGEDERAREELKSANTQIALGAIQHGWVHLAELALSRGDHEEALASLDEIAAHLDPQSYPVMAAWHDLARAALVRASGEPGQAEALAHAALERALACGIALVECDALEMLGVLAADAGRSEEAARLIGCADAVRERTGYSWRPAHRQRALDDARSSLDAAHLAEGATLSLDAAAEYVRRGRGERGRPDRGWASLTPAETRVIELVSIGLPNKEIAAKLFVSLATVKTHLVHVYRKLDVRSRAELAAKVALRAAAGTDSA